MVHSLVWNTARANGAELVAIKMDAFLVGRTDAVHVALVGYIEVLRTVSLVEGTKIGVGCKWNMPVCIG